MTIKENLAYLKYFGFDLTFWKTLNKIFSRKKTKISWKIREINNYHIEKYLKKVCCKTINEFLENNTVQLEELEIVKENLKRDSQLKNNVIWTMWWQGEENAPELVRACINSVRKNSNGHPVIVLDKDNFFNYITLPDEIMDRYIYWRVDQSAMKNCSLDNTRLSDIIRCGLLSYYGGVWCDATMFFSDVIPERIFLEEWSTLGQDNDWYIGGGRWSSFFMGCRMNNPLMKYVYKMHVEYFSKKRYWVHYLLIDYFIDMVYRSNVCIIKMIDEVKTENKKCLTINRNHDEIAEGEVIESFLKQQRFHNLSWRWWGNTKDAQIQNLTKTGEQTWFGYLYENYIKE